MHALHLVALRQRLRASRTVSQKLTVRQPPLRAGGVGPLRRLGSDARTVSSPSPRAQQQRETPRDEAPSGRNPFEGARPLPLLFNDPVEGVIR